MSSSEKSMIVRILICLEITLFVTSTMADYSNFEDGRFSNKRFCGRILSDSLALICDGEYEAIIHPSKRSEELEEYDQPPQYMEDLPLHYQSYGLLQKLAPESLRSRVRRDWAPRRGVYDECCRKPCSISELKNYCKRKN